MSDQVPSAEVISLRAGSEDPSFLKRDLGSALQYQPQKYMANASCFLELITIKFRIFKVTG